jgi:methylenetetrahydrofolate reductase (NADPH)
MDLIANGAPGVHLYTLNKAETCLEIVRSTEGLVASVTNE